MELTCREKDGSMVNLYKSTRGTCVKGLVVAISSLKMIMEEVVPEEENELQ
jgi:hypothetical protein